MANLIPPLVSNTPPPIDFGENIENEDDFGGFETSDVTFNNFIDDTPSLPSTPRDLSKTSESISEIDLPVVPPDDDIIIPIISKTSINQTEINSQELDNSEIIVDKIDNICDKPLKSHNTCNDGCNCCQSEISKACEKLGIISNEDKHDIEDDFDDFKLNQDPPSLMLSNNDLEDDDDVFINAFETINNNRSPIINEISKSNQNDDDSSVLSLKLEAIRISTGNSPILNETPLKHDDCNINNNIDMAPDSQTFQDNDSLDNDNGFTVLNKFQQFHEPPSTSKITFSNEFEPNFETHFEANFNDTEFSASTHEMEKSISIQVADKKSHLRDVDEDDFDEFKNFTDVPAPDLIENNNLNTFAEQRIFTASKIYDKNDESVSASNINDDDSDEFGDFSDFIQPQETPETIVFHKPVLELQQLNSVLDHMFPIQQIYNENLQIGAKNFDKIENNSSLAKLLLFDSTIALNYQWSNSNSNQVLVKSLGIDSRNILFGSKWNISVPRFAANLGLIPLEPLKQAATPTLNSYGVNNNVPLSKIQSVTGTDVPAAQFDWNSAGLVNPLDASQAHTLLLDLEQLVVVAKLDKIKLDSPSCSSAFPVVLCTTSATSITTTATNTTAKSTTTLYNATNNNSTITILNHKNNNINALFSNCDDGGGVKNYHNNIDLIKNGDGQIYQNYNSFINLANVEFKIDNVKKHNFDPFGVYRNYSQKETVRGTDSAENQPPRTEIDSIVNYTSSLPTVSTTPPKTILSPSKINPPIIASPINSPSEVCSSMETDLEIHSKHNTDFVGTTSSYVPSSTGNLRETHIFTPSKGTNPISRDVSFINATGPDSTIIIDKEFEELQLSSEIKINKNVITKEYRDVEYEFPGASNILQPIKVNNITTNPNTNIIINWPDPGDFSSSISLESGITSKRNSEEFEFSEFQSTNTIKYDPRDDDIEYDVELNKHNYENNNITKYPVLSSPVHAGHVTNIDEFLKPTIGLSPTEELKKSHVNNDLNDEFTEFQYVSPPSLCISSTTNTGKDSTMIFNASPITKEFNNSGLPNYNNLYEQSTSVLNQNNKQSINSVWADPSGVDSDEISRIEAAFSYNKIRTDMTSEQPPNPKVISDANKPFDKANNKVDDEWSEFVSSGTVVMSKPANATNMNNLISSNATTSVDDDWSDFVSVIPAVPLVSNNYKSLSSQTNNSLPNFSSWNSPIQYNSFKQSIPTAWISQQPQSVQGNQNFYKTHNNGVILNPLLNHNSQISSGITLLDTNKSNILQHGKSNLNINMNNNISNSNKNNLNNTKIQQQPNVSLIPDLGFIAPKHLINVPRTNFNK